MSDRTFCMSEKLARRLGLQEIADARGLTGLSVRMLAASLLPRALVVRTEAHVFAWPVDPRILEEMRRP